MSNDLVKRLMEPVIDPFFGPVIDPIMREAADRIEALETALQNYVCGCINICINKHSSNCGDTARTALEGKKDER